MANVTAPQFQQDVNNAADWANGDENTTVTMRLGQQADSPAKTIKDIKDAGSEAAGSIQFTVKGAFADGFTIDYYFELGETATGEIYRYKRPNALPFVVPAGFDPTVDGRFEQWVNTDHNNLTNRNSVGAHDDIYTRNFDSVTDLYSQINSTGQTIDLSLMADNKIYCRGYFQPSDGGSNWGIVKVGDSTVKLDDGGKTLVIVNDAVSGVWVEMNTKGTINLAKFGLTDDASTRKVEALQLGLLLGGPLSLPKQKEITIDAQINVTVPFSLNGNGSTLVDARFRYDDVAISGVTLKNIKLKSVISTGSFAPRAVQFYNISDVTFYNVKVENCNVRVGSNIAETPVGLTVKKCNFDCDFSGFDYEVNQEDCLQVYGIKHVQIKNNVFYVNNVHRVMKITAGIFDTNFNPVTNRTEDVLILGNRVRGQTTSAKQVCDMFLGTTNVRVAYNDVRVRGFEVVWENKTGYPYSDEDGNDVYTSMRFLHNDTDHENIGIRIQGAYGGNDWTQNSYDSAVLEGNTFNKYGADSACIDVRFLDSFDCYSNNIKVRDPSTASTNPLGKILIDFGSCGNVDIHHNEIDGGHIRFFYPTTNTQGDNFTAKQKVVKVTDNTMTDFKSRAGVYISNSGATMQTDVLDLSRNSFTSQIDESVILSVIWLQNIDVGRLIIEGGSSKLQSLGDEKVVFSSGFTADHITEKGNTWNFEKEGTASVSDGDTISHNTGRTPTLIMATAQSSDPIVAYVKSKSSNSFVIGLTNASNGTVVGTSTTVYWQTEAKINS